jgi:Cof subfamily protein (haloacid dehalogenase superfamily)
LIPDILPSDILPSDIRCAFFDIDGTLVSTRTHRMSQSTKNALACLRERGVRCCIASGRPRYQLQPCVEDAFDAYVLLSGQLCFDSDGVYLKNPIPPASVAGVVDQCERGLYDILVLEESRSYVSRLSDRVLEAGRNANLDYAEGDIEQALSDEVYQFCAFLGPEDEHVITDSIGGVATTRWCDVFCDVIPATGGKPEGVRATLDRFGLTCDQAIAFGDGDNDASMLECVGVGVAMGNGTPGAKAAADVVTDDTDDDGIWNACVRLGLV